MIILFMCVSLLLLFVYGTNRESMSRKKASANRFY